jgi:DNA-binding IclR family transcriptional regulator
VERATQTPVRTPTRDTDKSRRKTQDELVAMVVGADPPPASTRKGRDSTDGLSSLGTSVGKALALLDALGAGGLSLGVSELARRVDLPKSTAFRLLSCLEEGGYVVRRAREYSLGRRLFELGNQIAYCQPSGLRDIALPFLSDLYERTHQTVHLAILDGVDVLYLEKLFGHQSTKSPSHVGRRVPATCCGLGKAILAFSSPAVVDEVIAHGLPPRTRYTISINQLFLQELAQIREQGVAFDREEVALGLTCVAAPILHGDRAIAAISVTGSTTRFDPTSIVPAIRQVAAEISDRVHY